MQNQKNATTAIIGLLFLCLRTSLSWCPLPSLDGLRSSSSSTSTSSTKNQKTRLPSRGVSPLYMVGNTFGGGEGASSIVKDFSMYEQLQEIVQLASQALPERPDGIVTVVRYSSMIREECKATEGDYERMARDNPATIFLRCMQEYESADLLMGQANIQNWPTYDVFYGGNRVARVEGSSMSDLQDVLDRYQLLNSKLDLFSEDVTNTWGQQRDDAAKSTPKTTNRYVAGYDWNKDGGFFDEQGAKAEESFEETFGNWVPNMDDD